MAPLEAAHVIVTDEGIDAETVARLEGLGIRVVIARQGANSPG
jgi:hypothetical protein